MEFQQKLLKVGQALSRDETKALAFLCTDILKCDVSLLESPIDLFQLLEKHDVLSEDQPYLLADLLRVIQHFKLLHDLDLNSKMSTTGSRISPYRMLLYKLSENITKNNLKSIKFLLKEDLQRSRLEPNVSTLEVFLAMERKDILSSSDLHRLEEVLQHVCPVLLKDIKQFKASQGTIAQETGLNDFRPRSSSDISGRGKGQTVLPAYPMTGQERGFCWVVNNFDFSLSNRKHSNRDGTNIDEESLRRVFTWLGFKVEVLQDSTGDQMLTSMRELASRDHSGMDCVACVVLSHGLEGGVYGVDGKVVWLKELWDFLNGLRCKSLTGKPKLFFIQACQGRLKEQAVSVQADGPSSPGVRTQTDGPNSSTGDLCSDTVVSSGLVPSTADFLTAMAATPSYVSVRDETQGSWFIQSLCQNLVQMVPHGNDLVSILTKVNEDVSQKFNRIGGPRQMPQHSSSLRMHLVFPVPEDPPPV
ncbi:unnamed protein product [Lota lota]